MGLHLQGSSGSRGRARSDLNITPLVDVVLVLLVIFMVATPLTMREIPVSIPGRTADPPSAQRALIVNVGPTGAIELIDGVSRESLAPAELAPRLRALTKTRVEPPVFVDFDAELPYGRAVAVADSIRSAGVERINLVIEPPKPR